MRYLAFLRGINVGGKAKLPMTELRTAMEDDGFLNVRTYIQSGNVFFDSEKSKSELIVSLENCIKKNFGLNVPVSVFTEKEWRKIIDNAPAWWGEDDEWKHNILILLEPYDMDDIVMAIGTLKPDIENMLPGKGVLYQSMSRKLFGRTTTGKLASSPAYKRMTIRNYNTATKLLGMFED